MAASIAAGAAALLGLSATETWRDRISEAAYTSPKGTRIKFAYEALAREVDKRTTAFDFAGRNDSYVQENGHSSRRYPLRCLFTGGNCDRLATAFEAALLEPGIGRLEHPLYGTIDVVPFGTITRRDDLVNEANVSVVEVTFWTTTGAIYPQSQSHPQSEILSAIDGFDVNAVDNFAAVTNLSGKVQQVTTAASVRKFLREISGTLQSVADQVSSVRRRFDDVQSTLNFGLDVLVGQPVLLAQQITNLIRAPARVATGLASRLDGYADLIRRVTGSLIGSPSATLTAGTSLTSRTVQIANDFHLTDLFAMGALASSVVAAISDPEAEDGEVSSSQYLSRTDALTAADRLLTQFDEVNAWRDQGFKALGTVPGLSPAKLDEGGAYQAMQSAVAMAAGYLINLSFSLASQRMVELERDMTILNAAAELYGESDSRLDYLINANELTGTEILELPRGFRLVYYPPGS